MRALRTGLTARERAVARRTKLDLHRERSGRAWVADAVGALGVDRGPETLFHPVTSRVASGTGFPFSVALPACRIRSWPGGQVEAPFAERPFEAAFEAVEVLAQRQAEKRGFGAQGEIPVPVAGLLQPVDRVEGGVASAGGRRLPGRRFARCVPEPRSRGRG